MAWTLENYPLEMRDLKPVVRKKAIEIANQLRENKTVRELDIIEEAIRQAEEWFINLEG